MNSKETLNKMYDYIMIDNDMCLMDNEETEALTEDYNIIKQDLEILECFKKIDKKELKDFIENQIRYTLNENTWLSACNADLAKEKPTKHLIKIKEWLEDDR